ncbi:MAG: hypothetical protein HYZ81_11480 [Nitrospinae bacterium]|nr:hypothetical protein [Nitrospinota bacterium]
MQPEQLQLLLSPDYITKCMLKVHRYIRRMIRHNADLAFTPIWFTVNGGSKALTRVDLHAEEMFIDTVTTRFGEENIRVIGEESLLKSIDLAHEDRLTVLIDMIDGTDLLERNFSNWCSAIILFYPMTNTIEGAFVALPNDYLYFATRLSGAYKKRLTDTAESPAVPLRIPQRTTLLQNASICMYGQKSGNLLELISLQKREHFVNWLSTISTIERTYRESGATEAVGFRFYNLAGNPMMVKLAEGIVDVVFELKGQHPHDMAPGAFIATKAGAILAKATGEPLDLPGISEALRRPSDSQLSYVLAANSNLLQEICSLLQ